MPRTRILGLIAAAMLVVAAVATPAITLAKLPSVGTSGTKPTVADGTGDIWIHLYTTSTPTTQAFTWSGDLGNFTIHYHANDPSPAHIETGLAVGSYTVTQASTSAWTLYAITCVPGGPDGGVTEDIPARRVTIDLLAGEVQHCTFDMTWRQPDASIAKGSASGTYKGVGIYSKTAESSETQSSKVATGSTISFFVRIANASTKPDSFQIRAAVSGSNKFAMTFWSGTSNITSAVLLGSYSTTSIYGSTTLTIEIRVKAASSTPAHASRDATVTVTSTSRPAQKDVVRATATRS